MRNLAQNFSSIIIILTHVQKNVISQYNRHDLDCHPFQCNCTKTKDGKLYANCYNKNYKRIPTELGEIQILNISANPLIQLTSNDTKRYPELIELNMHSIQTLHDSEKFHSDFLLPLQKLEVLIISETKLLRPPIKLPPTIRKFYANGVSRNVSFINLSVLKQVTHLEMNNCSLHGLPSYLPKEAPLKQLHLKNNYLDKLRYTHLADYCLLEQLHVVTSELRDDLYSHCCDIKIWLEDHNVTNTMECIKDWIDEPCEKANYTPDSRALIAYNQCLTRNGLLKRIPFWTFLIIFCCFLFILSVAYVGFKFYLQYRSKKAAEGKVDDKNKNKK